MKPPSRSSRPTTRQRLLAPRPAGPATAGRAAQKPRPYPGPRANDCWPRPAPQPTTGGRTSPRPDANTANGPLTRPAEHRRPHQSSQARPPGHRQRLPPSSRWARTRPPCATTRCRDPDRAPRDRGRRSSRTQPTGAGPPIVSCGTNAPPTAPADQHLPTTRRPAYPRSPRSEGASATDHKIPKCGCGAMYSVFYATGVAFKLNSGGPPTGGRVMTRVDPRAAR